MARRLRRAAGNDPMPVHDALLRMVNRWEREGLRTERYELLYAAAFEIEADRLRGGPVQSTARPGGSSPDELEEGEVNAGYISLTLPYRAMRLVIEFSGIGENAELAGTAEELPDGQTRLMLIRDREGQVTRSRGGR